MLTNWCSTIVLLSLSLGVSLWDSELQSVGSSLSLNPARDREQLITAVGVFCFTSTVQSLVGLFKSFDAPIISFELIRQSE